MHNLSTKLAAMLLGIFILCGSIVVWTPTVARAEQLTLGDLPVGTLVQDSTGFTDPWVVLSHDHFGEGLTTLLLYGVLPEKMSYHSDGVTGAQWDSTDIRYWLRVNFSKYLSKQFINSLEITQTWTAGKHLYETFFLLSARELIRLDEKTNAEIQISGDHGNPIPGIEAYRDLGCPDVSNRCWTRSTRSGETQRAISYWAGPSPGNVMVTGSFNIKPAVSLHPSVPVYGPYEGPNGNYFTLFAGDPVSEVSTLIAKLPDAEDVRLTDGPAITVAKQAYDELTPEQQALIGNAQHLLDAFDAYTARLQVAQNVKTEIGALPVAADVTLGDKAAIRVAREHYDDLAADQQAFVDNYATLTDAEAALAVMEADAVQAVNDDIAALPDAADVTLADKPLIVAVRQAYEAFDAEQKALVDDVAKLEAAEEAIDALDAAVAQLVTDEIDALPADKAVTLADKPAIEAARQAYDALDADQQALVTNLVGLIAAEQALASLEADVQAVEDEIAALPAEATVTLADKPAIRTARQNYDALDADQRAVVTNVATLTDAEAALAALDAAAAQTVADDIAELPDAADVRLSDKAAIQAARLAYDALDADQKARVGNVATLTAAEQALAALEGDAHAVVNAIAALPAEKAVTLANKAAIRAARQHYNALNADQQALVSNLDRLMEAEAALAMLDANAAKAVEDAIEGLPDKADVTEADRAAIEAARELYNALDNEQQALVPNLNKLEEAEQAIAPPPSRPRAPAPTPHSSVEVLVNGKPTQAGAATTSERNGQTVYAVTLAADVLQSRLAAEGDNAVITVPAAAGSDVVVGILTGSMVKDMEQQQAVVEIVTEQAAFTLPASQVQIDAAAAKLGASHALQDVHVHVEVAAAPAAEVSSVRTAAAGAGLELVVPPLNFTVTATYGNNTVEITEFSAYVERTIAIPEGTDPSRITTAVVAEPDGTFRHVPTVIVEINGRHYARISSLTNSTYAVVWHPIEFPDVAHHWARDAVNDLGSRLVVAGNGDGLFDPDRDVTRAEFAAIVVRALGLRPEHATSPFTDVTSTDWFAGVIATASRYGLIEGFDGAFHPADKITREQAMVIIDRARALTNLQLPTEAGPDMLQQYADAADVSDWARTNVANCLQLGLVSGRSETMLAPKAAMTRAEVATLVRTLLQKAGLI